MEQGRASSLKELNETLDRAAKGALGKGTWVLGFADPYVVLSDAAKSRPQDRRETLRRALTTAVERLPGVARVIDTGTLPETCPAVADESEDALVCRAFLRGAGELYVYTQPGSFFDSDYTPGRGTNHGSPSVYDCAIPILARAKGRIAAGRTIEGPLTFATFTRTAAALLGVTPPSGCVEGTDLTSPVAAR